MNSKKLLSKEEEELLDFKHKRIYNQYLHEREEIQSLKNTDVTRMTTLGVIATVWLTTFVTLMLASKNLPDSLREGQMFILLLYMILFASFYIPRLLSHFKSVEISGKFVVNDRRHLMDEHHQKNKVELQEIDIELWRRRLGQTSKFISQTSYRLRKSEFASYLFVAFSILSIPLLVYSALNPNDSVVNTYINLATILYFINLIISIIANIAIIKKRMRKSRVLSYENISCETYNNNWNISIDGNVSPKCHNLSFWLCTLDSLITHVEIPVDKKGRFNHTLSGAYNDKITEGTQCFGILSIPENGKKPNVRLVENKHEVTYIANIISMFGRMDEISAIPLYSNYKADNLPLKICSLLDDAGEDEYVKCSFIYSDENLIATN